MLSIIRPVSPSHGGSSVFTIDLRPNKGSKNSSPNVRATLLLFPPKIDEHAMCMSTTTRRCNVNHWDKCKWASACAYSPPFIMHPATLPASSCIEFPISRP